MQLVFVMLGICRASSVGVCQQN